jgi:hypothetical protein
MCISHQRKPLLPEFLQVPCTTGGIVGDHLLSPANFPDQHCRLCRMFPFSFIGERVVALVLSDIKPERLEVHGENGSWGSWMSTWLPRNSKLLVEDSTRFPRWNGPQLSLQQSSYWEPPCTEGVYRIVTLRNKPILELPNCIKALRESVPGSAVRTITQSGLSQCLNRGWVSILSL